MYQDTVKRAYLPRAARFAPQGAGRSSSRPLVWIFISALFIAAILSVWSNAKVVSLGYEISNITDRLLKQQRINEKLKGERARLKAPGRLEPIAKKRLGLAPPGADQVVVLK